MECRSSIYYLCARLEHMGGDYVCTDIILEKFTHPLLMCLRHAAFCLFLHFIRGRCTKRKEKKRNVAPTSYVFPIGLSLRAPRVSCFNFRQETKVSSSASSGVPHQTVPVGLEFARTNTIRLILFPNRAKSFEHSGSELISTLQPRFQPSNYCPSPHKRLSRGSKGICWVGTMTGPWFQT